MSVAYVFNQRLNLADRDKIKMILAKAGITPIYSIPSDLSKIDPKIDIGVVGLPVAVEDETIVNASLRAFGGAGIRVIGIWLCSQEEVGSGLPAGFEKYGSATVGAESPELLGTLSGKSDPWETAGGSPRPSPSTKRNKC